VWDALAGRALGMGTAAKKKPPLSAELLSHTHFLHAAWKP
jgi:hypothetical protein